MSAEYYGNSSPSRLHSRSLQTNNNSPYSSADIPIIFENKPTKDDAKHFFFKSGESQGRLGIDCDRDVVLKSFSGEPFINNILPTLRDFTS